MGIRKMLAFVLALGMALLTACGATQEQALPEPTEELVVYCPPWMSRSADAAKALFERNYPDVQLTYRTFGGPIDTEAIQSFNDILTAELNAGKGPDLVLFT